MTDRRVRDGSRSEALVKGSRPAAPTVLDELARVRLVETAPGAYRIDRDASDHDDRVLSLALCAHHSWRTGRWSRR